MSVNVKPLADRVLVEPAAAEEKTAGGIIIPDTAKEKCAIYGQSHTRLLSKCQWVCYNKDK